MYYGDEEVDIRTLKYVLYARKSTDDPKKQVRSTDDQVSDCQEYAERLELTIIGKPIIEKKSAKKPNERPLFNQMLKDLALGKYDGILSWHPDRLARNMREGGEIIDMIDEGKIKDLQFVTHTFNNTPQGKMILGLSFVLSKQYSDDLSEKVTRGNRKSFAEGKAWTPKHGYINENHFYRPDGKNYDLIVDAWQMRKNGKTFEEILEYLDINGYYRQFKQSGKKMKLQKTSLSNLFKDPFYYGAMVQAKQTVDLRALYDFKPAITEEEYNQVQELSYRGRQPRKQDRAVFYPLKRMVVCSFCGKFCVAGASRGSKGNRYMNYRCDNKKCPRKKRSLRAKHVFNFIYDLLADGLNFTEAEYKEYQKGFQKLTDKQLLALRVELRSRNGALTALNTDINKQSLSLANLQQEDVAWERTNQRINNLGVAETGLKKTIEGIKSKIEKHKQSGVSLEQFLNLSKIAATKLEKANTVTNDRICRLIFLNLTINEEKVVSYELHEPFKTLLENRKKATFPISGHGGN